MENKFRESDRTVALGWEVSSCLLTTWCANTQHAPDPRLPQAGTLRMLCQ